MSDMRLAGDGSHPAIVSAMPCATIEKGVPMPAKFDGRGRPSRCPYKRMEVGDSFVWIMTGKDFATEQRRAMASVSWRNRHERKHQTGWRFENRTLTENGQKVIRIWRVS